MSGPNEIETVYGYMVNRATKAAREKDGPLVSRIMDALTVYEELWPEETERFKQRHSRD